MNNRIKIILTLLLASNLLLANVVVWYPEQGRAQTNSAASGVLPEYKGVEDSIRRFLCAPADSNTDGAELSNCINRLYRFGAVAGAFGAVLVIVLAGYYYIVLGEKGKTEGKNMIISVIAGLLIIFTAYILLRQINPTILEFRSIQPPRLLNVGKLPTCKSVGLADGCQIVVNSDGTRSAVGEKVSTDLTDEQLKTLQTAFEKDMKQSGLPVVLRPEWGASDLPLAQPVQANSAPKYVVIHHTADAGSGQSGTGKDAMKSIENLHVQTNKWSDVGYHFVIAPDGKIYQGRYGGPGVRGAHFHGANDGNIGISVMGNFEQEQVSSAAKKSLGDLLKYLKTKHSISYSGTTTLTSANVTVKNLAKHSDINKSALDPQFSTACPGKNLLTVISELSRQLGYHQDYDELALQ
jgi:hypothetical protein